MIVTVANCKLFSFVALLIIVFVTRYGLKMTPKPHIIIELNPFTHISDQERISPYNVYTLTSRQVMRIKKNAIRGLVVNLTNTKFSRLVSQKL